MEDRDCPICYETFDIPVLTACKHQFCFLCIKACVYNLAKCPLCRTPVILDQLTFVNDALVKVYPHQQWGYESKKKGTWWLFSPKHNKIIVDEYHRDSKSQCEVEIGAHTYVIDFCKQHQYRKNEPKYKRKICMWEWTNQPQEEECFASKKICGIGGCNLNKEKSTHTHES